MALNLHEIGLRVFDPDDFGVDCTLIVAVSEGTLTFTAGNSGVTAAGSGTSSVTLTGTAVELNNLFRDVTTGTLVYTTSVAEVKTFTLTITDASGQSSTIQFTATSFTKPVPVVSYSGGTVQVDVGVNENMHGIGFTVTDSDAGITISTLLITASAGTTTVTPGNSGVVVSSGNGTGSVTCTGTTAAINSLLNGTSSGTILYVDSASGSPTFTVKVTDIDGGFDDAVASLSVGHKPIVTAPTNEIAAVEDVATNVHGIGWDVTDADASGTATMVISMSVGTCSAAAGDSGVTVVSGSGTATVTITGTIDQLSNLLTDLGTGTITVTHTDPATGTMTVTVTDATSRVGTNVKSLRFDLATPTWTGYVAAAPLATTATVTDCVVAIDLSRLPVSWWDIVTDDGRDIRATLDTNANLPRDLVLFNKAAKTGLLFAKITHSATPPTIRIWAGAGSATAPGISSAFGQYNTYAAHIRGWWPDGGGNDRTQYVNNFTAFGGYTAGGETGVFGAKATSFNGTTQWGKASASVGTTLPVLAGVFVNMDTVNSFRTVFQHVKTASPQNEIFLDVSSGTVRAVAQVGSDFKIASAIGLSASGSWTLLAGHWVSATNRIAYRDGANLGGDSLLLTNDLTGSVYVVGARRFPPSDNPFALLDGKISLAFVMSGSPSAAVGFAMLRNYQDMTNQQLYWGDWAFTSTTLTGL